MGGMNESGMVFVRLAIGVIEGVGRKRKSYAR